MKTLGLAAAFLISLPLMADLKIELTPDKTAAVTSERVGIRIRVTNTATFAVPASLFAGAPDFPNADVRYTSVPAGWDCRGTSNCFTTSMAAESTVEFIGSFLTPTYPAPAFRLGAGVQGGADTDSSNSYVIVAIPVAAASRRADLQVVATNRLQLPPSTAHAHTVDIRNAGPDAAVDVTADFGWAWDGPASFTISGEGWSCAGLSCTRPSLAAGASAPIVVRFTTPAEDSYSVLVLRVLGDKNLDQDGAGGILTSIYTGNPGDWRMRLVPTSLQPVAGANNSLWKTDITMLVRAGGMIEIEPDGCEPGAPECAFTGQAPLREPFDPRRHFPASFSGGHYVWVRADRFDDLRVNARIYDANRQTQTAGAELPIPRDDEFSAGTVTLLNIPLAPQFRHTLRIYDDAARDGMQALIRIYADDEIEPRAVLVVTLRSKEPATRVTTAQLPVYPAMAELQLAQLLPLEGIDALRVEVQPVGTGPKIWAFVTITNNETHHVTTVTP